MVNGKVDSGAKCFCKARQRWAGEKLTAAGKDQADKRCVIEVPRGYALSVRANSSIVSDGLPRSRHVASAWNVSG